MIAKTFCFVIALYIAELGEQLKAEVTEVSRWDIWKICPSFVVLVHSDPGIDVCIVFSFVREEKCSRHYVACHKYRLHL